MIGRLNKNILILLALIALLISVFLKPFVIPRPVYSFQVTFDLSHSMEVEDHQFNGASISRLDASKKAAEELLQSLPCGSRMGWSVFARRRVVSLIAPVEVCEHYAGLMSSLSFIDSEMRWANASGVGKGLHQSIRAIDTMKDATRIIFFTDGQEAPPLRSGDRGMPKTDRFSVSGLVVGVGGLNPVRIPKTKDADGNITSYWQRHEVVQKPDSPASQSNEELSSRQDVHLSKLGRLAELIYLPMDSTEQLRDTAMVDTLSESKDVPVNLRWIPAALALLFLCIRFLPLGRRSND